MEKIEILQEKGFLKLWIQYFYVAFVFCHSSTLFANSKWHQVPSDFVLEYVFGKKQPVSETVSEIEESDLEFPDENAEKEKQKKSHRIKKTKK